MDERNDSPTDEFQPVDGTDSITQYIGTAKEVVDRYTHCALCGANLHFSHVTDFGRNITQETARCPECGVKVRQRLHHLQ